MRNKTPNILVLCFIVGLTTFPAKVLGEGSFDTTGLLDLAEGTCGTVEIDIHYTDDTVLGCGVAGDYIAGGTAIWMRDAAVGACLDFVAFGFRGPYQTDLPDFDFYVTDEANGGGGTALWDCIGLDSRILRCDDEIRIRKTTLHELFHNVQRQYLCDLGMPCDTDVYMGSTFGKWVAEGTARFVQDKVDLDVDLATGDSSHYWESVRDFMDNYTDTALVDISYRACLFWNYMCERMGTTSTEPELGIDFMVEFWENYIDLATTDSIAVLEQTIAEMGDGRGLDEYFLDYEICNITKDYDVTALLHPERYFYVDERQAGATVYESINPTNATLGVTDSNESVEELAARFYEIDSPSTDCQALGFFGDLDDTSQNAGWALVGIKADGVDPEGRVALLLKGIGTEFGGAVLQNSADPFIKLVGIVVGLDASGAADIDFDYTFDTGTLTPQIVSPTILSPLQTGVPGDGVTAARFLTRVFVDGPADLKPDPSSSVAGLLPEDFDVSVGGTPATVLAGALIGADYYLVVESIQVADGIYSLEVSICDEMTTQNSSVIFSDIRIDEMIAIDVSGSMGDPAGTTKLDAAKIAASLYVDAVGDDDKVGLVTFSGDFTDNTVAGAGGVCNDDADVVVPLDIASLAQRDDCKNMIAALTDGGWTSIGDGLRASQNEFDADPMVSRVIVLLSDGHENEADLWDDTYLCSDGGNTSPVDDTLVPSDTVVHTIAFGPETDEILMADVSTRTGGTNLYVDVTAGGPKTPSPLSDCILTMPNQLAEAYQTQQELARGLERIRTFCGPLPESSTAPPETVVFQVDEDNLRDGLFFFNWDDPFAFPVIILTDPSGAVVGPASGSIYDNDTHKVYHLSGPKEESLAPGLWAARIQTPGGSNGGQYLCGLSARSHEGVQFHLVTAQVSIGTNAPGVPTTSLSPGIPVQLVGFLTDTRGPIRGADVRAHVQLPDRTIQMVHFQDNGNSGDGQAEDGVYASFFTATALASGPEGDNDVVRDPPLGGPPTRGSYVVNVAADGKSNFGSQFHRDKTAAFHVARDLSDSADSDKDGLPDAWEIFYGKDPNVPDADDDPDKDGLPSGTEFLLGTHPCDPDTDGGGETDGSEVEGGRSPLNPKDDGVPPIRDFGIYEPESHEPLLWPDGIPVGPLVYLRYPTHPAFQKVIIHRRACPTGLEPFPFFAPLATLEGTELTGLFIDRGVLTGQCYQYRAHGEGPTGQTTVPSRIVDIMVTADPIPPDGAVRIMPRPVINDLNVDVALIGDGSPTHYRIGDEPITGLEPLVAFPPGEQGLLSITRTLPGPAGVPGPKTIYAKFYDATGNVSDLLLDSVRYVPAIVVNPTPTETPKDETPTNTMAAPQATPTNTTASSQVTPTNTTASSQVTPTNTMAASQVTPTPSTTLCPDVNRSGRVDVEDLLWVLEFWLQDWPPLNGNTIPKEGSN